MGLMGTLLPRCWKRLVNAVGGWVGGGGGGAGAIICGKGQRQELGELMNS